MPTGFTPNGDGLNQGFGVPDIFETVSFIIYDRWGGKVFSGDNNHPRWDGTINGELASPGVYVYMFEAILKGTNQRISYGGSVTLIR
jgi:gliding motility-associated-like protein